MSLTPGIGRRCVLVSWHGHILNLLIKSLAKRIQTTFADKAKNELLDI